MKKPFTGRLAEPIKWDRTGKSKLKGIEEIPEKMRLLFGHYGLPVDYEAGNLWLLVLEMARDSVPGFSLETPKKRRPENRPRLSDETGRCH